MILNTICNKINQLLPTYDILLANLDIDHETDFRLPYFCIFQYIYHVLLDQRILSDSTTTAATVVTSNDMDSSVMTVT